MRLMLAGGPNQSGEAAGTGSGIGIPRLDVHTRIAGLATENAKTAEKEGRMGAGFFASFAILAVKWIGKDLAKPRR